ncbi:MAG: hypothetical protein Q9219_001492 [cf. Caloplaca sp. 3 TL-2023]
MPLIRNLSHEYNAAYGRIQDELEALDNGASDDIFQTSASPFAGLEEEQVQTNDVMRAGDPVGVAARMSHIRQRLQLLLPVDEEVRPPMFIEPQLIEDWVEHFRHVVAQMPHPEHPLDELNREDSEIRKFASGIWSGRTCRFPDQLLRRLRPYVPVR